MKFKYEEDKTETRKAVAKLYKMNGNSDPEDLALWIKTSDPNKHIWLYTKGISVTVQSSGPPGNVPIKTFYKGDTLEITF